MSRNEKVLFEVSELVIKALDNALDGEEFTRLQYLLKSSPEALEYYFDVLATYAGVEEVKGMVPDTTGKEFINVNDFINILVELGRQEKMAPPIYTPKEDPEGDMLRWLQAQERSRRKIARLKYFSLSAAASVAALFLIFLTLHFTPDTGGKEVATLADMIQAKWGEYPVLLEKGMRMKTSNPALNLREGYAELHFDNNTKVTIEAPAEFEILTNNQIQLHYGRLYACVPEEAYGFTVSTEDSKIIDLGTEFGVQENATGQTEVHVIKGRTNLVSRNNNTKINATIVAGSAKKIDRVTGSVEDVKSNSTLFTRDIDSGYGVLWKGQNRIDLADIVGGGNGLQTGTIGAYVNTATGKCEKSLSGFYDEKSMKMFNKGYITDIANEFIDGVFVPCNTKGSFVIDSYENQFDIDYALCDTGWGGVLNVPDAIMGTKISLSGKQYGVKGSTGLFMHANAGVTFDLDKIRQAYSNSTIKEFTAHYGICDKATPRPDLAYADFWVLVDGEKRFVKRGVQEGTSDYLHVPIGPTDRFLTIMTTDGGVEGIEGRPAYNDWCLFGKPELVLK